MTAREDRRLVRDLFRALRLLRSVTLEPPRRDRSRYARIARRRIARTDRLLRRYLGTWVDS